MTYKSTLFVFLTCIVVYFIEIVFSSVINGYGIYEKYPTLMTEIGFGWRLLLLFVPMVVSWIAGTGFIVLLVNFLVVEIFVVLLASVGFMFGASNFVLGVPVGLVVQDVFMYLGVGYVICARKS